MHDIIISPEGVCYVSHAAAELLVTIITGASLWFCHHGVAFARLYPVHLTSNEIQQQLATETQTS